MKKQKNGVLVLVVLACLFLATRPPVKQATGDVPTLSVLADIVEAFAYNIEQDGPRNDPRLTHTAHVGQVFDDFGKVSGCVCQAIKRNSKGSRVGRSTGTAAVNHRATGSRRSNASCLFSKVERWRNIMQQVGHVTQSAPMNSTSHCRGCTATNL